MLASQSVESLRSAPSPAEWQALLTECQLDASLAHHRPKAWEQVWQGLPYRPVGYSSRILVYHQAYFRGAAWRMHDYSLILQNDGRPCGIFPLTLGGPEGQLGLNGFGGPLMAPLFVQGLSATSIKKICSRLLESLQALARQLSAGSGSSAISNTSLSRLHLQQVVLPDQQGLGLSEWSQQLLAAGAAVSVKHELFIDLSASMEEIRSGFRKSFRPLINAGLRHWQHQLMDQATADAAVFQELKDLHLEVAGRRTRSDESWQHQFEMIVAGEAFLLSLRDPQTQRMVGAGLFHCNQDEGLYGVGAYDRSLFDKPLGHVVQQLAIEHFKRLGIRWYRLGERQYAQDQPPPSDKQLSISAFKQGFASHVFARQEFDWALSAVV